MRWVDEEDVRSRVDTLESWPDPVNRKELLEFLKLVDEYRNDLWDYKSHIKPLVIMSKDTIPFIWGEREQGIFNEIRKKLVTHIKRHSKSRIQAGVAAEDLGVEEAAKPGNRNLRLDDAVLVEDTQPLDVQVQKDLQKVGSNKQPGARQSGTVPSAEPKAYRLVAPVQKPGLTNTVVNDVMDTEVRIKLGDLMAVSGEVSKGVRSRTTKTRQPVLDKENQTVYLMEDPEPEEDPFPADEYIERFALGADALHIAHLPMSNFFVSTGDDGLPVGSVVIQDPVETYLNSMPKGEHRRVYDAGQKIYAARESGGLRCLFPLVNGRHGVESVLDTGSQIVSMSLKRAVATMLTCNPDIKIHMESANGELKETEGLAKNVPFLFGDLTIYLQVHVIEGAPYDILLGRPFDILTESTIRNRMDGGSTITISCPNTKRRIEMPTYKRGARTILSRPEDEILGGGSRPATPEGKAEPQKTQVFQTLSRN